MMKQIISRGREFKGFYILYPAVLRHVACSGVTTPFESHCRLGHPSLPLLKRLSPVFEFVVDRFRVLSICKASLS